MHRLEFGPSDHIQTSLEAAVCGLRGQIEDKSSLKKYRTFWLIHSSSILFLVRRNIVFIDDATSPQIDSTQS